MSGPVTVLWLVDERDLPASRDERFHHVVGNPDLPVATITMLLAEGAILAVVRSEQEGRRAIAYGADEVILAPDAVGAAFEKAIEQTTARARARLQRDLFLIDLVRKDDTAALEFLATALGEEIVGPLTRAKEESKALARQSTGGRVLAQRALELAETVSKVEQVVQRVRELVRTDPTDEVVDMCAVTREATRALDLGVRTAADFEVSIPDRPCPVGMPRWQLAMVVGSLITNAVESVIARGGGRRRVSVRVFTQEGAALLEVADDGEGMDEDVRVHASDPFFTTSESRVGLGLTLVSARVRRAGGELIIESDPGVGTTVRVYLPLIGAISSSGGPN